MFRVSGDLYEHPLDYYHRLRGGCYCKTSSPRSERAVRFYLTTILGIVGAFVATYLGQAVGWYRADEGAGLVGAVVGAVIVLVVWGFFASRHKRAA
jgi:uncharacterized membrane protein YeaQ/YmgE (transglycosylase-associated protein family)